MRRSDEDTVDHDPLPTDFDQLKLSKWGLDWGDISQIHRTLSLTPRQRLETAQDFLDGVLALRDGRKSVHRT